ncbi:MAG: leucine-rich repeat domain-containing protein [Promethearchaeota archaeon]
MGNLTSLEELHLKGNKLSSLPESICNLNSLKKLWLNENDLIELSESMMQLCSLKELHLDEDKLLNTPDPNLKKIINYLQEKGVKITS